MISSIRHNHPLIYSFILLCAVMALISMLIYGSMVLVSQTNNRVSLLANAVYWQSRAVLYDGLDKQSSTPATHFVAEIRGMKSDGSIVFTKWGSDGFEIFEAELADLKIIDASGTRKIIERYKGKKIFVDYYQYRDGEEFKGAVVLWDEFDAPLNSEMVERHVAEPIETPPTNIVNTLMARYFWKLLRE